MFRSIWILILIVVLSGWVGSAAQEHPQLTVVVYNDAGVPAGVIESAKRISERIYRDAEVAIVWKDHSSPSEGGTELFVRIVRRSLNLPGEDFGIAFVGSDGRGSQADIFYSGIEQLTKNTSADAAQVMGHLTKVTYFGALVADPGGRGLEQWLVMGFAACFAVLGTTLSRRFLDRLSDNQFYYWTRRVILAIGAVYIAQGVWQVAAK